MTDIDTDKIFEHPNAKRVVFSVSRLICDVERFEDDSLEEMSSKGMGVCYTTNSFGKPLRTFNLDEKNQIIKDYYRPHHKKLTEVVEQELKENGISVIVDCHSFSNIPLPHEDSQTTPRPDVCIGTDSYHTPDYLLDIVKKHFLDCGYTVKINDPFAGTLIPMKYYKLNKKVIGIMIELNRSVDFKNDVRECLDKIATNY
jgi:N-formylglutamate amidohydrolase